VHLGGALHDGFMTDGGNIRVGNHDNRLPPFHRRAHRHSHHGALADAGIANAALAEFFGHLLQSITCNILADKD
jgi:hypothetical protein